MIEYSAAGRLLCQSHVHDFNIQQVDFLQLMIDTQTQDDAVDDDDEQENDTEVDVHDELDDHDGTALQTNVPRTKIKLTEAELVGQVGLY